MSTALVNETQVNFYWQQITVNIQTLFYSFSSVSGALTDTACGGSSSNSSMGRQGKGH